ncbi:hypothetical protein LSM04_008312 [Trypanosoma melophagium]|uniref:uncharacterized protein n=1 Tax=Trypanosoma melophagium TaxID=715481 RepID=UPI00351A9CA2|nr:hypothetical protein LSM04_008312 [Trypanosoma melophagium]
MMEETERDPFQAFFQSSEESVSTFLRTFVELSAVERALLTVGDPLKECVGENAGNASFPVKISAEAECFVAAVEAFRAKGEEKGYINDMDKKEHESIFSPPLNGGSFPVTDVDVEEIQLDESSAVKTSTMTAFLNYGCTDVLPTFDNFIQADEKQRKEEKEIEAKVEENNQTVLPSDKKTLHCEGLHAEDKNKEKSNSVLDSMPSPSTAISVDCGDGCSADFHSLEENKINHTEQYNNCNDDENDDSFADAVSDGEVELPGLATDSSLKEQDANKERCNVFLSTKDLDVLREVDDEVQPFALDPYFDYYADMIGSTARLNDPRCRV